MERIWHTNIPVDRDRACWVSGGTLKIVAKCERFGGMDFTSARLHSSAVWGPGIRVEVRARLPGNKGNWPAIWMLPKDQAYGGWPKSGEIDIMESVGCQRDVIHATVHTGAYNWVNGKQRTNSRPMDIGQWHVYTLEWTPSAVRVGVDGSDYFTFARESGAGSAQWPFDKPFYLILNNAVGGSWGGMCLQGLRPSCSDRSQFAQPQVMEVDYARVYRI